MNNIFNNKLNSQNKLNNTDILNKIKFNKFTIRFYKKIKIFIRL